MAVLRVPIAKVILNFGGDDDEVTIASGFDLISLSVQEGEQDRANSCQVTLHDPNHKLAGILQARSLKVGAIAVPKTLFEPDETVAGAAGAIPGSTKDLPKDGKPGSDIAAYIGGTVEISLSPEARAYLDLIAWCEGAGYNTIVGYAGIITNFSKHPRPPIGAAGSDASGRYQFISTTWAELGLSNFQPQNQDLGAWKLIQQRGAANAVSMGLAGIDEFMTKCARVWASIPYPDGSFHYAGQGSKTPQMLRDALTKCLNYYKSPGALPPVNPAPDPDQTLTAPDPGESPKVAPDPQPQASTPKDAIEVTIVMGWSDGTEEVSAKLWYVGHSMTTNLPPRTVISGQGVRFLLQSGDKKRQIFKNISLRQIFQRIGDRYGVNVKIPSTPASEKIFQSLAQKGMTDHDFLMEVGAASGFLLKESGQGTNRVLEFVNAAEKGGEIIKVVPEWGCTFKSGDRADKERLLRALPPVISLADGKAIGEGYSTTINIANPTIASMRIQPGTIIEVGAGSIAGLTDKAFLRQYRVKANNRRWEGGLLKQELSCYIPVHVEPKKSTAGTGSAANPTGASSKPLPKLDRKGKYFLLTAMGRTEIDTGLNILKLSMMDGQTETGYVWACSGLPSVQDLSQVNVSMGGGPIPPNMNGYQLANGEAKFGTEPFGVGLGQYVIDVLTPGTNRGGILIHEDSNYTHAGYPNPGDRYPNSSGNESSPGTLGCVGVWGVTGMQQAFQFYLNGAEFLVVDFSGWVI